MNLKVSSRYLFTYNMYALMRYSLKQAENLKHAIGMIVDMQYG